MLCRSVHFCGHVCPIYSIIICCTLVKNQFDTCVDLILESLSCFFGLCIYSFTNTTLSWLLYLYSKSIEIGWGKFSNLVHFKIMLDILITFVFNFINNLSISIKILLEFLRNCIQIVDYFEENVHLNNTECLNPRTLYII